MRRFIRPIALCVFVVLVSVPAVSLKCDWSCAKEQARTAMHHHGHHPTARSHQAAVDVGRAVFTPARELCSHSFADIAAISISVSRVSMLCPAVVLEQVPGVAQAGAVAVKAISTDKSPPRASRPRSVLRI